MIVYLCDRNFNILGQASSSLPQGLKLADDKTTEDAEKGVNIFTTELKWSNDDEYDNLWAMSEPGMFVLKSGGYDPTTQEDNDVYDEFYTIVEREMNTKNKTIDLYCEDAGLDLINQVVPAYEATSPHNIVWYVNHFVGDTGWIILDNDAPTSYLTLSWDGESTLTARLASIANFFGKCEIYYSFLIQNMKVKAKYINISRKRGNQSPIARLHLNKDIDVIKVNQTIGNIATALNAKGAKPEGSDEPITLEGYEYDDGDYYIQGKLLKSRVAENRWSSLLDPDGVLVNQYSYDTLSQSELLGRAKAQLEKLREIETNYSVEIKKMPQGVRIGDAVNVIAESGDIYLQARILKLETSITKNTKKATLGEWIINSPEQRLGGVSI